MNATDQSIEELCESIVTNTLRGGALAGVDFRPGEAETSAGREMIVVKAGAPVPRLEGERGYRVEVEITMRAPKPSRTQLFHREALARLTNASHVRTGALASGLTVADSLTVMDEEIGGERSNSANLRKRTITVPLIIALSA